MPTGKENDPSRQLQYATEKNRLLREENDRLKALVISFSLHPASAMTKPKKGNTVQANICPRACKKH
ncbi:MAG TPA: hypothetical protein PLI09_23815 [Candidatus Hydrogenedentes bacterium]|mgnify:CR=1 FL=1|nr:hypothetical protein [Candidatus Hydrogenedentota bacterium]